MEYQTGENASGMRGAAVPTGGFSGANASPGRSSAPTGLTGGPALPSAPPAFNDGWARSNFSSELTPEEQRQRDALKAASTTRTAQETASVMANKSSPAEISGSGTWLCWRCGSSNGRQAPLCHNCHAKPLTGGKALPRTSNREGGRDGSANQVRRSDPSLARNWRHINLKARESVPQASQTFGSAVPPLVHNVKLSDRTDQQNWNDSLRQMRLRREETTKDGRYVGLSPRGRQEPDTDSSILDPHAIRSHPDPSPSVNREGPSRGPNIIWTQSSGANFPKHPTPPQSHATTAPDPSPESFESPSSKRDHKGWTRWAPPPTNEQHSQPVAAPELDGTQSTSRYAQKDEEREVISYHRSRRRAEKFDIEPPIESVKYESNRHDRDQVRPRRRRQDVQEYDEEEEHVATRAERKRQKKKDKAVQRAAAPPTPIILPEFISIANLAGALRVRTEDFTRKLTELGFEETGNDHVLDAETAGLIATEFNFEPVVDRSESEDLQARPPAEDKSSLPPRPPVVTIMGHVDHGKTTLLDWLRKSSVAASEHGGITQHIGAFSVSMPSGRIITFLDTPGHAAFLSMRQRGANVTDIVILVVAADDSVKPQTIEAINHAKAAKVPIIVAVNKIDKEDANAERVKLDLGRHGVDVEDFGGDTQVVCVSGKTGQGMDELEDAAIALADILDMRSETDGPAEGWVLEATTKKAGRVATVLVRRGTMRPGDVIVAGNTWARVRSLRNEAGVQIPSAGPGTPVEVDGWREQPAAGDEVLQAPDEQKAKSVIELRLDRAQRIQMATDIAAVNETRRLEQEKREREDQPAATDVDGEEIPAAPEVVTPGVKEVFFVIKADVSGSVEAVLNSVSALGNSEVRAHVLRSGVGPVTEFDIEHAAVAKGYVVAFNTVVEANISRMAEAAGVGILESNIIYRLVDDVKGRLEEQLTPLTTQKVVGEAEVAQVFEINVKGRVIVPVAGCRVRNGAVTRNGKIRVLRDKEVVFDGTSSPLEDCPVSDIPTSLSYACYHFLSLVLPLIPSSFIVVQRRSSSSTCFIPHVAD